MIKRIMTFLLLLVASISYAQYSSSYINTVFNGTRVQLYNSSYRLNNYTSYTISDYKNLYNFDVYRVGNIYQINSFRTYERRTNLIDIYQNIGYNRSNQNTNCINPRFKSYADDIRISY